MGNAVKKSNYFGYEKIKVSDNKKTIITNKTPKKKKRKK